jgi:hypothetical protein
MSAVPYPQNLMGRAYWKLGLDFIVSCGYVYNMQDRKRQKNSMVHVRFTEKERRILKAHCALEGITMQEYIRAVVLKKLPDMGKGGKTK